MIPINYALMLLAVGMGTVFLVLLLVIFCSRGLIAIINRWFPEKAPAITEKVSAAIPSKVIAAITSAVNIASNGKAKIVKIEKSNK